MLILLCLVIKIIGISDCIFFNVINRFNLLVLGRCILFIMVVKFCCLIVVNVDVLLVNIVMLKFVSCNYWLVV